MKERTIIAQGHCKNDHQVMVAAAYYDAFRPAAIRWPAT